MGSAARVREQARPPECDARSGGHGKVRPAQHAESPMVHPVGMRHHRRWSLRRPRLVVSHLGQQEVGPKISFALQYLEVNVALPFYLVRGHRQVFAANTAFWRRRYRTPSELYADI